MADEPPEGVPANASFPPDVIARVHDMADTGHYPIRGLGARRKLPTFDDLVFLTASVSRYPLEGYRERCETKTVLGGRHGATPLELDIPITIAGMSFGALSALGQGGPRPGRHRSRHVDHHRRRRHDPGGAQGLARSSSTRSSPRATASTRPTCARPTPSRS